MVALLSATSIIEGYYMRASNIHNLNYTLALTFLVIFYLVPLILIQVRFLDFPEIQDTSAVVIIICHKATQRSRQ